MFVGAAAAAAVAATAVVGVRAAAPAMLGLVPELLLLQLGIAHSAADPEYQHGLWAPFPIGELRLVSQMRRLNF